MWKFFFLSSSLAYVAVQQYVVTAGVQSSGWGSDAFILPHWGLPFLESRPPHRGQLPCPPLFFPIFLPFPLPPQAKWQMTGVESIQFSFNQYGYTCCIKHPSRKKEQGFQMRKFLKFCTYIYGPE